MSKTPGNRNPKALSRKSSSVIAAAKREAATILAANRTTLDALAEALLEKETLEAADIVNVLSVVPRWRRLGSRSGAVEPTSADAPGHAAA